MIGVVLPDKNGNGGLKNRLDKQDRKLEELWQEAKPNGGTSKRLGDIALRTEEKVDAIGDRLDQHIAVVNKTDKRVALRLRKLETPKTPARRASRAKLPAPSRKGTR